MRFIHFLLIILAAIFQTTVMHYFSIKLGMINIILVVFVALVFFKFFNLGLVWAVFGGILLDFLSSFPSGLFLFGFLIIYSALALLFKVFEFEEPVAFFIIIFLASVIFDFFIFGYLKIRGNYLVFNVFYNIIIFDSLLNVGFGLFLYPVLIYINRHFLSKKQRTISLIELYK